ncbi:MAG: L,D-transpeptidase family protein [Bdellovibrionales bacterium]|nr:L,D-transpeptidase family protein [Bdellovibrionales bacterium]
MIKLLLLITLPFLLPNIAIARTWKQPDYDLDQNRDEEKTYKFGVFETVAGYEDPDYSEALELASPLKDDRFQSYDVIIVINIDDEEAVPNARTAEGQHMRVYIRPDAIEAIGWERFHMDKPYDPDVGLLYYWKVSTAVPGRITPRGHFSPEMFSSEHRSTTYNNASMPWAVFFTLNYLYATHGTTSNTHLGKKASHGCVRVETQRARDIFHLIGANGKGQVDVINRDGSVQTLSDGVRASKLAYKTLYIVK